MQVQERILDTEPTESSEVTDSRPPGDKGSHRGGSRYGWMALALVVAIATGVLVFQVISASNDGFQPDPSYTVAEQNRFQALHDAEAPVQPNTGDPSYEAAEQNRFQALSDSEAPVQPNTGDPSYEIAEQNRFQALAGN